jgi:2-dehydro-3-deoxyphosphogluconate aldolase / (4S)-4-hydroxy-2-oxoglutarate aldolase
MSKIATIQRLLNPGIIAILRSSSGSKLGDAAKALVAGGVTAIEVTMTTPGALTIIRDLKRALGDAAVIGAGTVLDAETARSALFAGAEYLVTPVVQLEVIQSAIRYGVPIMSGAMTPTEALAAHQAGADFIKIFPAEQLGAGYVKAIKGPLPMLQIIPMGGVTPENLGSFMDAGACAVGAGGHLVSGESIENGDWPKVTKIAGKYVAAMKKARGT